MARSSDSLYDRAAGRGANHAQITSVDPVAAASPVGNVYEVTVAPDLPGQESGRAAQEGVANLASSQLEFRQGAGFLEQQQSRGALPYEREQAGQTFGRGALGSGLVQPSWSRDTASLGAFGGGATYDSDPGAWAAYRRGQLDATSALPIRPGGNAETLAPVPTADMLGRHQSAYVQQDGVPSHRVNEAARVAELNNLPQHNAALEPEPTDPAVGSNMTTLDSRSASFHEGPRTPFVRSYMSGSYEYRPEQP